MADPLPRHRLASILVVAAIVAAATRSSAKAGSIRPASSPSSRSRATSSASRRSSGCCATRRPSRSRGLELLRGAAVVYLTVTFFVVIFLLSGEDVQLELVWVDVVLHKIFPIVVVLDWIVDPPKTRLTFRDALLWLVYPARLDRPHPDPRCSRRLVSVPIPRPGQWRLRDGGHRRRRDHARVRWGSPRSRSRSANRAGARSTAAD